ncbi:hypothetical protein [Bradyrhizobium sp.]|uniref:hypothetical protein n=1 Tax=Bradyrhizobium sp. TaxID=376 RepID=UPI003C646ED7
MADTRQTHTAFVLTAVILVAAAIGGIASFSAVPADEPADIAILGAGWQCSNMVLFTSCTRVRHLQPAAHRMGRDAHRMRPV